MRRASSGLLLVLVSSLALSAQGASRQARPIPAIDGILDAFATHDIVTVSDPHGRVQMQQFLLALIRDPRFASIVNDVVIESASARHQDVLDRFTRGEAVPLDEVRRAWEDTTVPNSTGVQAAELIGAVRIINATLSPDKRLRVIAGDPPIDWSHITSRDDHWRWIELRDSYPADLIQRQVVERNRRALVIYGQMHTQRQQLASNYDMSSWQSQTVVSLLERRGVRLFNVWSLFEGRSMPDGVDSWVRPGLALTANTDLGAVDFATYFPLPNRFGFRNGVAGPIPRSEWRELPLERQFDAVLFLGPPSLEEQRMSPALCSDARFLQIRAERIALAGLPAAELEQLEQACR